jgi:hypothetical protein
MFLRPPERGSASLVFRAYIRTMLEQHTYDIDAPIVHRGMRRGLASVSPCVYVRTTAKQ